MISYLRYDFGRCLHACVLNALLFSLQSLHVSAVPNLFLTNALVFENELERNSKYNFYY